jgi:hypothetical protein
VLIIEILHIPSENIVDYIGPLITLTFSILGAAIVVRRENIRGHTGWSAVLFGLMMLLLGMFLLIGTISMIFSGF